MSSNGTQTNQNYVLINSLFFVVFSVAKVTLELLMSICQSDINDQISDLSLRCLISQISDPLMSLIIYFLKSGI